MPNKILFVITVSIALLTACQVVTDNANLAGAQDNSNILPPNVKEQYKVDGVYAYFRFVEKPENRNELKLYLRDWYKKTYHKD